MNKKRAQLFIATPTSGGIMKSAYVNSLAAMLSSLHAAGVGTRYANLDATHIPEQRDTLVHMALQTDSTHVLFIDSDMMFAADLAAKFLTFGKPLVGAIYTRRKLDLARVESALAKGAEFKRALAMGHDFTTRIETLPLQGEDEFRKVQGIGFGFVLVARECFETMTKRLTMQRYPARYVNGEVIGYFQEATDKDGQRVSEDYSFCQRWRDCGGDVWGHVFGDIKHVGDFAYGVPYATLIGLDRKVSPKSNA